MADRLRAPDDNRTPAADPLSDQALFGAQQDIASFAPAVQQDVAIANFSQPITVTYKWDVGQPLAGVVSGWAASNNSNNAQSTIVYLSQNDANDLDVSAKLLVANYGNPGPFAPKKVLSLVHIVSATDPKRYMDFAVTGVTVVPGVGGPGWVQLTTTPLTNSGSSPGGEPSPFDDFDLVYVIITPAAANDAGVGVGNARVVCTSTTHPTSPAVGLEIYETDTGKTLYWHSATTGWQPAWNSRWGFPVTGITIVANQTAWTTITDASGLTLTWTAVGHRFYRYEAKLTMGSTVSGDQITVSLTDASNNVITTWVFNAPGASFAVPLNLSFVESGIAAGSVTRKLRVARTGGTGTGIIAASATNQGTYTVEDAGSNGVPL